jgi:hypothetical protein
MNLKMETANPESLARARQYVAVVRWQRAKSTTFPHEYTIRQWRPEWVPHFEWFVNFIRIYGDERPFYRVKYIYLEMDGYKYWTMGAPIPETTVINREPLGGYRD